MGDGFYRSDYFTAIIGIVSVVVLYFLSSLNYLLFHSIIEIFSVVVAAAIFIVGWNSRKFQKSSYLAFLGIAFLFIGMFDLLHTLAYEGMSVFPVQGANLATQLWIAARFVEAVSIFIMPFLLKKRIDLVSVFLTYGLACLLILLSIFSWQIFPTAYIDGVGLTPFKIISEYIISGLFLAAVILLYTKRAHIHGRVRRVFTAAIIITILSELSFTLYQDAFGILNVVGHILKLLAFLLIYKAIIETGIVHPYDLIFQDLRKSRDELKHERDLTKMYLDIAGVMFVIIGKDEKVQLINHKGSKLLGYQEKSIVGKNWFDHFIPAREREQVRNEFRRLMSSSPDQDHSTTYENLIQLKSGQHRVILWHNTVIRDVKGRPLGTLSSGEDVTPRKQAEEEREEFFARIASLSLKAQRHAGELEAIFSSMVDAVVIYDSKKVILQANPAAIHVLGFDPAGMHQKDFIARIIWMEQDKPPLELGSSYTMLDEALRGRVLQNIQCTFDGAKDRHITALASAAPIFRNQEVAGAVISWHDITEQQQIQEELRLAELRNTLHIRNTPIAVIELNPFFQVLRWNPAATRIFGFGEEEVKGKQIWDLVVPKPRRAAAKKRWLLRGRVKSHFVMENVRKSGKHIRCEWFNTQLIDHKGNVMGIACMAFDITKEEQAEQRIKESLQEKELLLSEIHHRVKNNLQIISSLLNLQARRVKDPRAQDVIKESQGKIKSMALMHQKLYQSRDFAHIDFCDYLKDLVHSLAGTYAGNARSIGFKVNCDQVTASIDTAIPSGLIVHELVINSIKYAFPEGRTGEVTVSCRIVNDNYVLAVADDGIGLSKGIDPAHPTTLGLELVNTLVKQLDGTLEWNIKKGTLFIITFPLKPSESTKR